MRGVTKKSRPYSGEGRVIEFRTLMGDGPGPCTILDVDFREP